MRILAKDYIMAKRLTELKAKMGIYNKNIAMLMEE